jgi:hypothetical protein
MSASDLKECDIDTRDKASGLITMMAGSKKAAAKRGRNGTGAWYQDGQQYARCTDKSVKSEE